MQYGLCGRRDLAHKNIKKKWTMTLANWGTTAQKLAIWFPGRMVLDLQ